MPGGLCLSWGELAEPLVDHKTGLLQFAAKILCCYEVQIHGALNQAFTQISPSIHSVDCERHDHVAMVSAACSGDRVGGTGFVSVGDEATKLGMFAVPSGVRQVQQQLAAWSKPPGTTPQYCSTFIRREVPEKIARCQHHIHLNVQVQLARISVDKANRLMRLDACTQHIQHHLVVIDADEVMPCIR